MCDRIWVPPYKDRKDRVNIEGVLKNEFLSLSYLSLVLILHFIVRTFSHYINIKRIKARRGLTLSLLLSRGLELFPVTTGL